MKAARFFALVLVGALLVTMMVSMGVLASAGFQATEADPQAPRLLQNAVGGGTASPSLIKASPQDQQAIIIDHTCTDLSQVPDYWLEQAKELAIHYAHTSHGSQIVSGIIKLEQVEPKVGFDSFTAGSSPPSSLACSPGVLCLYDGNPPETYITPEDYWETPEGVDRTRAVADTRLFNYSMWSWCGQQSYYSETQVQQYLATMAAFEVEYPDMRFILMTGHTDGGSATLERNNELVRQYSRDHHKVLFDFADIETYDPLGGGPYVNNSEGTCSWCVDFCNNHPQYCTDLPTSCAHSYAFPQDALFCKLKGQAFWWMMARLAGWDGTLASSTAIKTASAGVVIPGDRVTYTVVVQDLAAPSTTTVHLTDDLPEGLSYIPGTLTATAGTVTDTAAPLLTWSGVLSPTPAVTVTYAVTVSAVAPQLITNTAVIAVTGYEPVTRTATITLTRPSEYPGFEPSYKAASAGRVAYGEVVTYTVVIAHADGPLTNTIRFTDTIPAGLLYLSETLTATTGVVSDTMAPTLTWSGILTPTPAVTITYAAQVVTKATKTIINVAEFMMEPGYWGDPPLPTTYFRQAGIAINGYWGYVPLVMRDYR